MGVLDSPSVTLAEITPANQTFYDRNLLENARPFLVHDQWGQVRTLPKGSGTSIKFRRPNTLSTKITPLSEGITPSADSFGYTDVSATPLQYGGYVTPSDRVDLQNQDSVLTDIAIEQGYQAGQTADVLRRDVLVAGTSVFYANGSARASVNTVIATDDLQKAIRLLRNNNCGPISSMIVAGRGVGTEPIRPAYFCVVSPNTVYDIESMTGFISVEKYSSQGPVAKNEIGSWKNIRFVMTTYGKVWAGEGATGGSGVAETGSNADVYASLIFGNNAYGLIPVSGMSLTFMVQALGSAGAADPLRQRSSAGWKLMTTTKILNDNFMTRIEHAVTA